MDFAIAYVDNQSAEVRNAAIDLLVTAALNGGEERVKGAAEKLGSNLKEMVLKKVNNAIKAKEGGGGKEGQVAKKGGKGTGKK